MPGLIVIAPYSAADAKGLLKAAIRTDDPVVFLENELLYGQHFDVPQLDDYVLPIGKARIVRPGKDVTIVSYSIGVGVALEAAQELMAQGINAEVIDLRTLRPLDKATVLESLKRTNRMVVVEEGWPACSISSRDHRDRMTEGFDDLDAPVLRVTDEDVPLPYAANLEKLALIKASRGRRGGEGRHLSLRLTDRDLVRLYWPVELRPAFDALFDDRRRDGRRGRALDPAGAGGDQARLVARAAGGARQRQGSGRAAACRRPRRELLPRGISGAELARLEEGWARCSSEVPWRGDRAVAGVARLFALGCAVARRRSTRSSASAGACLAHVDAARRGRDCRRRLLRRFASLVRIRARAAAADGLARARRAGIRASGEPFEAGGNAGARLGLVAASADWPTLIAVDTKSFRYGR